MSKYYSCSFIFLWNTATKLRKIYQVIRSRLGYGIPDIQVYSHTAPIAWSVYLPLVTDGRTSSSTFRCQRWCVLLFSPYKQMKREFRRIKGIDFLFLPPNSYFIQCVLLGGTEHLPQMHKYKLTFCNKVLKKFFEPKREKVAGGLRNCIGLVRNFITCTLHWILLGLSINEYENGEVCSSTYVQE
jgi:hypothetical protein